MRHLVASLQQQFGDVPQPVLNMETLTLHVV